MFGHIYLMLGEHCNFQCKYCLQHPIMKEQLSNEINPDLIEYFRKLATENQERQLLFQFYGGEPLLYWSNVVFIHQALKDCENIRWGMISNGALLNDEMVEYMLENNIGFAVSNDGESTEEFRGENVVNNELILSRLRKLNASVSATIHAKNHNLRDIFQYWFSKGFIIEQSNIDMIMDSGITNKFLTDFDWVKFQEEFDSIEEEVYQSLKTSMPSPFMYFANGFFDRLRKVTQCETDEELELLLYTKCGVGYTTLNVDLQGNCYLCHNSTEKIGTIYNSYDKIIENFKPYDRFNKSEKCRNCPVFLLCRGGCILVDDEPRERYYCKMMQIYLGAFINAILKAGSEENV